MKHQRGFTLSGLIMWGVVIGLAAVLGMKVIPDVIDFYKVKKAVASTAYNASGKTVPEIRSIYGRYAEIDQVDMVLKPADLEITKEGGRVVISFAYDKRIPLFANVSLLLDFQGASVER